MPKRDPDFLQDLDIRHFGASELVEEPGPDLWQRMSRVMEVCVYILGLGVALKLFWPEVERQRELNRHFDGIEATEASKQSQVAALRQKYELLKSDREYLETVARDRLDLARDGEYVVRIGRDEIPEAGAEGPE
jgi:cell division protein FtsB